MLEFACRLGMLTAIELYAYLYILSVVIVRTICGDVLILTDANYTDSISNYEVALIKFYVPW